MKNRHILVVDDELNMRHLLSGLLSKQGCRVVTAGDGEDGVRQLVAANTAGNGFDVVLCDMQMPVLDGMGFLEAAGERLSDTPVIMMSAYATIDTAVKAMQLGAFDYISKPFKMEAVLHAVSKAIEREALRMENQALKVRLEQAEGRFQFGRMIAESDLMQAVFSLGEKAARYDTTVLVTGESGTGKELMARGIHYSGKRKDHPFVPVNCGGLPETLVESELFGYVRGAFTGADRDHPGLFAEADTGTLFLDEIGELPAPVQVKLLRVLQEQEVRPVGATRSVGVDVRVIAATSRNLSAEVAAGRFREDLFYRLNVLPVHLPPLRERDTDISPLAAHFLERLSARMGFVSARIDPSAMRCLVRHAWPGNVRELENVMERAAVMAEGRVILPEHLPAAISGEAGLPSTQGDGMIYPLRLSPENLSIKKARMQLEADLIRKALETTGGNRTQAARLLEISHPSLLSKMKTYRIIG
ncbi:MAG: hypothetical protein CSA22_07040 [Deltaproteobacteria bacterium]|nr:MAG: hypothetical protein CSA22_07040 [Deltaproteobacteria bacterium]